MLPLMGIAWVERVIIPAAASVRPSILINFIVLLFLFGFTLWKSLVIPLVTLAALVPSGFLAKQKSHK
jgi:hypothetical protein